MTNAAQILYGISACYNYGKMINFFKTNRNTSTFALFRKNSKEEKMSSSPPLSPRISGASIPVSSPSSSEPVLSIREGLDNMFRRMEVISSNDTQIDPLVASLATAAMQNIPMPHNISSEDAHHLSAGIFETLLQLFPSAVTPNSSPNEVATNLVNQFALNAWDLAAKLMPTTPSDNPLDTAFSQFFNKYGAPISNHLKEYGVEGILTSGPSIDLVQDVLPIEQIQLNTINEKYGTSFTNLEEACHYDSKIEFRSSIEKLLKQKEEKSQISIRDIFLWMVRNCNQKLFSECISEDITAKLNTDTSPILALADLFIQDFIQSGAQGFWFQSGDANFGYRISEEKWGELLVSTSETENCTFINKMTTFYLDIFESLLNSFNQYDFGNKINQFVPDLEWILSIPFEELPQLDNRGETEEEQVENRLFFWFQKAFIRWAIEEIKKEDSSLIDDEIELEIPLRILRANSIRRNNQVDDYNTCIQREEIDPKRLQLAQKTQDYLTKAAKVAEYSCKNLIGTRKQEASNCKTNLTMGIGYQGSLFSNDAAVRDPNSSVYISISETGRAIPARENQYIRSFFTIPFLYAMEFSIKFLNQKNHTEHIVPTIISYPSEEDKLVHKYFFNQMLYHYFMNRTLKPSVDFVSHNRNELITSLKTGIAGLLNELDREISILENENRKRSVLKSKKNEIISKIEQINKEYENIERLSDAILAKLESQTTFYLDEEEFNLLMLCLENKSSICVESLISRQSKNSLIVPISFNQTRADTVKVKGTEIRVGTHQRPVIPPCDKYCQLFSASHMLWAELTRNPSVDELNPS